VYVCGKPFKPHFVFAGKVEAYLSEAPFRCFIGISLLETEPAPTSDKCGENYILSRDSLLKGKAQYS
jgi:hypothetical protein